MVKEIIKNTIRSIAIGWLVVAILVLGFLGIELFAELVGFWVVFVILISAIFALVGFLVGPDTTPPR